MTRAIDGLARFFTGPGFAAFTLAVLLGYEAGLVALTLAPPADTGFGAFAARFRAWCLGADPETGTINWGYALGVLSLPLVAAGVVAWVWAGPLAELRDRPRAAAAPLLAAFTVVAAGVSVFALVALRPADGELPFPAEALRTALDPPPLRLTDQNGATVDLAELRGKVVLLTGLFASCRKTCPMIMAQAKSVVGGLSPDERADLRVVAVTLDPEHDTREVLAALADVQGMAAPTWHLVTGEPARVERTLDLMNIARVRDPETGQIDHANLFLLVDRRGRLAYRFTLGGPQERWLATAVRLLLRESGPA